MLHNRNSVFARACRLQTRAHTFIEATSGGDDDLDSFSSVETAADTGSVILNSVLRGTEGRVAGGVLIEDCELSGAFMIGEFRNQSPIFYVPDF